jgi:hypothetical protein
MFKLCAGAMSNAACAGMDSDTQAVIAAQCRYQSVVAAADDDDDYALLRLT